MKSRISSYLLIYIFNIFWYDVYFIMCWISFNLILSGNKYESGEKILREDLFDQTKH